LLSAHTWTIIGICAGLVIGMAAIIWLSCDDDPRNDAGDELGTRPRDEDPDALAAA
jgi:hypothetical protein